MSDNNTKRDPGTQKKAPYSAKDAEKIGRNGYRVGHEDAVNQTVAMADTNPLALLSLLRGDARPYRASMRRRRRSVTD